MIPVTDARSINVVLAPPAAFAATYALVFRIVVFGSVAAVTLATVGLVAALRGGRMSPTSK